MVSLRGHVWLDAPADAVWAFVGNPGSVGEWFTSIASVSMDGDVRTLTLKRGGTLVEKIVTRDNDLRRLQYAITDGLPVDQHLGTVDVIEAGPNRCLVLYSTDVAPAGIGDGMRKAMTVGLAALADRYENKVDDFATGP